MKRRLVLLANILIFTSGYSVAQEFKYVFHDVTIFDSIQSIFDWKESYLSDEDIEIYPKNTNSNKKSNQAESKWSHDDFLLKYKGVEIEYSTLKMHSFNGKLKYITGEIFDSIDLNIVPLIDEETAFQSAKNFINAEKYIWETYENEFLIKTNQEHHFHPPKGDLVICKNYTNKESHNLSLAYKFEKYAVEPLSKKFVYVDAHNSEIIHSNPIIMHADGLADTRYSGTRTISTDFHNNKYRLRDYHSYRGNGIETYNMNNGTNFSSSVDFTDDDNYWSSAEFDNPKKNNAALDVHWGSMIFYDYFKEKFDRNGIDDEGSVIRNYVHYGQNLGNAFWDSSAKVAAYGDGNDDWDAFASLDLVSHELGHGLTQSSSNLVYSGESGAINEGVSDVFSACIENYVGDKSFFDIWTFAEDIDLRENSLGMRHMFAPKTSNPAQPDTYLGTNWDPAINSSMHTNSGVFSYWFYLLSVGGIGVNDLGNTYNVSGISIEKAEKVLYTALTNYFTPNTNYSFALPLTILAAQEVFGFCSEDVLSVRDAWNAVGVGTNFNIDIPSNLAITQTLTPSSFSILQAINKIEASNIIEPNSEIIYRAGEEIVLKTGFSAKANSKFHAFIEECDEEFIINKSKKGDLQNDNIIQTEDKSLSHNEIKVYPNPFGSKFNIDGLDENNTNNIYVYSPTGQLVYSKSHKSRNVEINLENQNSGIYYLLIKTRDDIKNCKIVKK